MQVVSIYTKKVIAGWAQGATIDTSHWAARLQKKPWCFLTLSRIYSTMVSHSNQMLNSTCTVRKAQTNSSEVSGEALVFVFGTFFET